MAPGNLGRAVLQTDPFEVVADRLAYKITRICSVTPKGAEDALVEIGLRGWLRMT